MTTTRILRRGCGCVVLLIAPRLVVRDTHTRRHGCGSRCVWITPRRLFVTRIHDDTDGDDTTTRMPLW